MGFTPEQIKGRIKSVAKQNNADARTLMRIGAIIMDDIIYFIYYPTVI